jgi:hypothetical protein
VSFDIAVGHCKYSCMSSIPLFFPLRKFLASSPLYVKFDSGSFNKFLKTEGANEIWELLFNGIVLLFWKKLSMHRVTISLNLKTSGTQPPRVFLMSKPYYYLYMEMLNNTNMPSISGNCDLHWRRDSRYHHINVDFFRPSST